MNRIGRCVLLFVSFLLAVSYGPDAPGQQEPSRERYRDRYGVLSERNIFLRERGRRRREEPTSRPAFTRSVEDSFILRGVVLEDDGRFHAYVESLAGYSVLKLAVGDAVANGKIARIEMDAIEYEQAGRRTRIEIGQTLTGEQAAASQPSALEFADSATQPASGLPINPNDPNLTIEQKMKLRRQQELNRK